MCNGVKYTCKVIVEYLDPNFGAMLTGYNYSKNYFTVKFNNRGAKTLYITSGVCSVNTEEDDTYYDRKVKLKSKVTIKPGKTKSVKFYVKGRRVWPDYTEYYIDYKFKYDGKTYYAATWEDDSIYYLTYNDYVDDEGYDTYWDEEWYLNWW